MTPVTVTIITYNEEANLQRCLESVAWADEIVVVDSHSTDATRQIARRFTDRVIERDWQGHIAQKNAAIDLASHDWVFAIDADEVVTPTLRDAIQAVLREGPTRDGYRVARLTRHLGRWVRHGGWYPDWKVRLFNRTKCRWGGVDPHDKVMLDGEPGTLTGDLEHHSYADLSDHIDRLNRYTTTGAQELAKQGKRPRVVDVTLRPIWRFLRMYLWKGGFRDGRAGFLLAVIAGFYVFLRYAKLWELRRSLPAGAGPGLSTRGGARGRD